MGKPYTVESGLRIEDSGDYRGEEGYPQDGKQLWGHVDEDVEVDMGDNPR